MTNQEMIDEVMDNFDFRRVAEVMEFLDWKWWNGVPDEAQLRSSARKLLNALLDNTKYSSIGTGGFQASRDGDSISLRFVLEYWEVEDE